MIPSIGENYILNTQKKTVQKGNKYTSITCDL